MLAAITPPDHDALGVLTGTAQVMHSARLVRICSAQVDALAQRWSTAPWPEQAGLDALHFTDDTERTANWILLLDALNFCFWGEPGEPRWRVTWQGERHDGYYALAAALTRALSEGYVLWDARLLATMHADQLREILRPDAGCPEIPLFEERVANVREIGQVLLDRYDGQFATAITAAGGSAADLVLLLATQFPSFRDVATWEGQLVPFYKRAQICVADIHAGFHGRQWGAFHDLANLTAFADYKLPQLLRRHGVLEYATELAEIVDAQQTIAAGSPAEIEIRAATIWSVELLRRALTKFGIDRTASDIDYRLWADSQSRQAGERPYHRTRTIFY